MAKRRATNVEAQTFTAECPCGGGVLDKVRSSFQLDHDSIHTNGMECESCEAEITIKVKTARLQ